MVEERMANARRGMGVDELIRLESECARADITKLVAFAPPQEHRASDGSVCDTGQNPQVQAPWSFDLQAIMEAGQGHLIRKLSVDKDTGRTVIELHDAAEARRTLGAWYGLGRDTSALTGQQPGVTINVLASLPPAAAAALYEALVGQGQVLDIAGQAVEAAPAELPQPSQTPAHAELDKASLEPGPASHAGAHPTPPPPHPESGGTGAPGVVSRPHTLESPCNSLVPMAPEHVGVLSRSVVARLTAQGVDPSPAFLAPSSSIRTVDEPHLAPIGGGFPEGGVVLSGGVASRIPETGGKAGVPVASVGLPPVEESHLSPIDGDSPLAFLLED